MYLHSVLVSLVVLIFTVQSQINQLGDMKPAFFNVPSTIPGACNAGQTAKLEKSFREAAEAVQKAVQAIDNLRHGPPSKLHAKQRKTWKRQAQLIFALFRIKTNKNDRIAENDAATNIVQGMLPLAT